MKKFISALAFFVFIFSLNAQTTREEMAMDLNKTGGVYYAYPTAVADNTPAPEGYKPFHISHYGRHGSRYCISDNNYTEVRNLLHKADSRNALTPLGKVLMSKVDSLYTEAGGKGGDLTPLGRRQHKGISNRMFNNYPEVFTNNSYITARSTLVPRCIISMLSFIDQLKENNPKLDIDYESSNKYMNYLCHSIPESDKFKAKNSPWKRQYENLEKKNTHPDRLVSSIFSDSKFIAQHVNPHDFMWSIHWLAADAQNTEGKIDFFNFFTADELFDLWQSFNARFYAEHADYIPAKGVHIQNAANLLNNIIDTAEEAMAMDRPSAALRFGHDGNIVPLAALMSLEGCDGRIESPDDVYKGWCDWKVTPMAANIQMIFFRNDNQPDKILVKILHNEKETHIPVSTDKWPYYDWNDVKSYFQSRIK